ncbi:MULTISPECIES: TetR/AcrR family transcriptional regulator [unclassified Adlercreutzia]|uniref:TetR/AcrR family transcriptional regulator n=1 Tax=unclassified Adlercreutzia TaxID=2636013 RepID=UPI0013ECD77A|nr:MULTISPECIES: TetR/AcrR family transcriptional regulator [unclassified Adlercreutzia]
MDGKKAASEDRRVKRTRQALRKSLIRLLRVKPLAAITTSELCRAADVNRNTFYAHYKSPLNLFEEIQEESFEEVQRSMRNVGSSSLFEVTCEILRVTKENRELSLVLSLEPGILGDMAQKLWNLSRESWLREWGGENTGVPESKMERTFTYAASGYVAVQIAWIRSGMREDIEDVARSITDMSLAAIRAGLRA